MLRDPTGSISKLDELALTGLIEKFLSNMSSYLKSMMKITLGKKFHVSTTLLKFL